MPNDPLATAEARCSVDDIRVVVRSLRAACLRYSPDFGDDQAIADIVDLWYRALAEFDSATLYDAAQELIKETDVWPVLSELTAVVQRVERRNATAARPLALAGETPRCGRCGDDRWVETSESTKAAEEAHAAGLPTTVPTVYPCPACNHTQFLLWQGGHLKADHDYANCSEEACKAKAKHRRRR